MGVRSRIKFKEAKDQRNHNHLVKNAPWGMQRDSEKPDPKGSPWGQSAW